jgi:uncharacterized protein (TIRG00374 family)
MLSRLKPFAFLSAWAVAAYFGWRLAQGGPLYFTLPVALYAALGLLWMAGRLSSRARLTLLNLGVLGLLADVAVQRVDLHKLGEAFRLADYRWIAPAFAAMVLSLVIRSYRWKWMLGARYPHATLSSMLAAMTIGISTNIVIPARLGEVVRAVYLKRRERIPVAAGIASVVLERLLDAAVLFAFLIVGAISLGLQDPRMRAILIIGLPVAVGGLAVFFLWTRQQARVEALVRRLLPSGAAEKLVSIMDSFLSGAGFFHDRHLAFRIFMGSLLGWLPIIANIEFTLRAFPLAVSFPWATPFVVISFLAFFLSIPVTPGGVGVFQFAAMSALALSAGVAIKDLGEETALAFGIMLQVTQALPIVAIAGYYMLTRGISMRQLVDEGRKSEEGP